MIHWIERKYANTVDSFLCGMMNSLQWRLRHLSCSPAELEEYLDQCVPMGREEFFSYAPAQIRVDGGRHLSWATPHASGFEKNDTARAEVFWSERGPGAPTVLLLHALMSARAEGYRNLAQRFNQRGWNAVFIHLPFHYSRAPDGFWNGSLAITANLIRNGETLRQAVKEIRQLMAWLRGQGTKEFGLIGTSYGGWVGALSSFLEEDWRFLAFLQPIANVQHAIWENPGAASMRRILLSQGITRSIADRHHHLTSPQHGIPLVDPSRILICAGEFDCVSPLSELERLSTIWEGSLLERIRQGHFGYRILSNTMKIIDPWLDDG